MQFSLLYFPRGDIGVINLGHTPITVASGTLRCQYLSFELDLGFEDRSRFI
jgi:hypothetical protein